jgi:aspartate beta-hydroxylase
MTLTNNDPAVSTPAFAQQTLEEAMALHGENRLTEAEALYVTSLSHDPDNAAAMVYLGLLRLQQNKPEASAALLRRALELDPASAEAHTHLGAALHCLGSYDQALACHDRALALAPDYIEALRRRGDALQALGQQSQAMACYEAGLVQEPDNLETRLALASALTAMDRQAEAFVHYRSAAALEPKAAAHLSQALGAFTKRHADVAQAGMLRLNSYIGSFLVNHGNARMGTYPGLSARPFRDPAQLPGALMLERNYEAIRSEIENLAGTDFQKEAEGLMDRGAWDVFLFYERGLKNAENCARCPAITRIIEASNTVRTMAGLLYVSKLNPDTHIKPHVGPTNLRVRCHLGIRIPSGDCGLKVADETRHWQEGKCLVFDDCLRHEAWNNTQEPRIVLIVDFWHPDLSPAEIAYLEGLHRFALFQATSLNRYWSANAAARSKARTLYD